MLFVLSKYVCMFACVCLCVEARDWWQVSLSKTLSLRHCLSLNLELSNLASLACQPILGAYLYLLPKWQDHRWTTSHV